MRMGKLAYFPWNCQHLKNTFTQNFESSFFFPITHSAEEIKIQNTYFKEMKNKT